ncbi:MAG: dipeptide epimerase [Bacteroidetes bacterium]|nr:dipeptide epimerase [Bacteroidota bacterium]
MLQWTIEEKKLPLKYQWKISRNTSDEKTNLFVTVKDNHHLGMGEAAPNIRYNESPESLQKAFAEFLKLRIENLNSISELTEILNAAKLPQALRFAVESAFIHYFCHKNGQTIYELLDIPEAGVAYTAYSLPIMEAGLIGKFIEEHHLNRFRYLKIKVNNEEAIELVKEASKYFHNPIMVDGNETWKNVEDAIRFAEKLEKFPICGLEQPIPAGMDEELIYMKKHRKIPLFGDESCIANPDFDLLEKQFDGINMKLMKTGGYLEGIRILNEVRKRNLKTMIGCMVETSLGISSALYLSRGVDFVDLDGFMIIKKDPFNLVVENDGLLRIT